jgi:hypothetical protein
MGRETGANPAAEPPSGSGAAGGSADPPQRVGPVELERLRKDDGRALILFSRVGDERP